MSPVAEPKPINLLPNGWTNPKTAADGDHWESLHYAFEKKWGETLCLCGHSAWHGESTNQYHEPNQGTRCRAPFLGCACVEFKPMPCAWAGGCDKFSATNKDHLCVKHILQAQAAPPMRR